MGKRLHAGKVGLLLLGALLFAGFFGILEKRFAEGGIYPLYASFRSDPLGTSAFYESLEQLGTFTVSRNRTPLNQVGGLDEDTAILLLGYPRDGFEDLRAPDSSPVMKAVGEGARLVITMNPELVPEVFQPGRSELEDDWIERRRRLREKRASRRDGESGRDGPRETADTEEAGEGAVGGGRETNQGDVDEEAKLDRQMEEVLGPLLTDKLGFGVPPSGPFERPSEGWETRPGETISAPAVPSELPAWRSQYRFEAKDPAWKVVAYVGEEAVVIERVFGGGSIVLASDTYFASNESLHHGAEPGFLLWLTGGKAKVIFDETIHGTTETGGAMKLIRRYRAHGVIVGILVFVSLWAWRSATPLVRGGEAQDRGLVGEGGMVLGEGTGTGLIRLLRRSVPSALLLSRCVEVWAQSRTTATASTERTRLDPLLARHQLDPKRFGIVDSYRAMVDLLRKR
jgi:hypothetical protein